MPPRHEIIWGALRISYITVRPTSRFATQLSLVIWNQAISCIATYLIVDTCLAERVHQ